MIEWSFLCYSTFWTSLGWRHQKFPQNNSSGFVVIGSGSKPANESWNTGRTDNSLRVTWIHKLYPSLHFRAAHTTPSVACLSPWSSVRQAFSCSLLRKEWSVRHRFLFRFSLKTPNWTFLQLSILPWYIYFFFLVTLVIQIFHVRVYKCLLQHGHPKYRQKCGTRKRSFSFLIMIMIQWEVL